MTYDRFMRDVLERRLTRPFVEVLFGARQTGKTWLLRDLLDPALSYNLADPAERARLAADPDALRRECKALPDDAGMAVVFVDEAQLVPSVFDSIQVLYDEQPGRWKFFLCGSSARKMRTAGTNLLPGRAILHHLHPLTLCERPPSGSHGSERRLVCPLDWSPKVPFPPAPLEERLAYGDLPGIAELPVEEKGLVLRSYADIHLHEEIRREGLVKDWGAFINFLRLAASESGSTLNYSKLSNEVGLSVPTIKSHYQLLEDMFVGFTVQAFSGSTRKNLLSTPRFLFFDIGVRHAAAGLEPGPQAVRLSPGAVFEQWVGMELHRRLQYAGRGRLTYFRTRAGAEIDYVVETEQRVIPLEVKWTERPTPRDARHLDHFLQEHPNADAGYVVCRCSRPQQLSDSTTAIPWHQL